MTYQESLFNLETMQDRSGRQSGRLHLPVNMRRGECMKHRESRSRGEQSCAFLACKYHLTREIGLINEKNAIKAMVARLSGEFVHTCALDLADSGPCTDKLISEAMGIDRQHVAQRAAEAGYKFRRALGVETSISDRGSNPRYDERMARRAAILRARDGDLPLADVADEFGVSEATVCEIWKRHELEERDAINRANDRDRDTT